MLDGWPCFQAGGGAAAAALELEGAVAANSAAQADAGGELWQRRANGLHVGVSLAILLVARAAEFAPVARPIDYARATRLCQRQRCAPARGLRKTNWAAAGRPRARATRANAACSEDLAQAGSATAASPAKAKAWQRQPPQSISRNSQERQGSRIQSVPRNVWKASEWSQMSRSAPVAHVVEGEARDGLGRMAGQHLARRRDVDDAAAPAAHAGLGPLGVVVGHHEIDHEDALQALARAPPPARRCAAPARASASAPGGSSAPSRSTARAPPRAAARRG